LTIEKKGDFRDVFSYLDYSLYFHLFLHVPQITACQDTMTNKPATVLTYANNGRPHTWLLLLQVSIIFLKILSAGIYFTSSSSIPFSGNRWL